MRNNSLSFEILELITRTTIQFTPQLTTKDTPPIRDSL